MGVSDLRLASGVNLSVVKRSKQLLQRFFLPVKEIVFCGGVAQNKAVVRLLRQETGADILVPPAAAVITGRFGCCRRPGINF
jgi:activator of 2-hydroxyglutaryl-CoA dehydratase